MQSDIILPVYQGGFHGARTKGEIVYIRAMSFRNCIQKHINQWATEIISHIDVKLVSVPCYFNII